MDDMTFETKKLEYEMAQEMLRHYDSLNWQIGSILCAAALVLTGLALNKDLIELARSSWHLRLSITCGIPLLSIFVLGAWLFWFRRHRAMYNLRSEVLHRLEIQLGMFHHLLSAVSDGRGDSKREDVENAKRASGHDEPHFRPLYPVRLQGPSGYCLARLLGFGVPIVQLVILWFAYWSSSPIDAPGAAAWPHHDNCDERQRPTLPR